jgi:hypothetical protein
MKYLVLVGINVPSPNGERDKDGKSIEVRFEPGDEVTAEQVGRSLNTLLEQKWIEALPVPEPPSLPAEAATKAEGSADSAPAGESGSTSTDDQKLLAGTPRTKGGKK